MSRSPSVLVLALLFTACGAGDFADDLVGRFDNSAPGGGSINPTSTPTADEYAFARDVWVHTNNYRAAHGLPPLTWHEEAAQVAYEHSMYQQGIGNFTHFGPNGETPGDRLTAAQIGHTSVSENVAVGQLTPAEVVDAWANSPGHNLNLLTTDRSAVGVGARFGPGGSYDGPWWTQVFLEPQ